MLPAPARTEKYDLTSGSLGWNLFRLAAPAAVGSILDAVYNLVDAYWLKWLGTTAQNAPAVNGPLFFIVFALGMGLGTGGTALVAQYTGAKQYRTADRAAAQTMVLLCTVISTMALLMFAFAPQVLRLTNAPEEALPGATAYLRIALLGFPFVAFRAAYGSVLRALGDTMTVVAIGLASNLLNLALDPVLIFGWLGFPAMGVAGAALATVISQILGAAACWACMMRGRAGLRVTWADARPDWPLIRHTVQIGTPAAIAQSFNSFGLLLAQSWTVNPFGTVVVTAYMIGFRILHFLNAPMFAMAMAAAPVVGHALGANKPDLARRAVMTAARVYGYLTVIPIVLLTWQGDAVASLLSQDEAVIAEAAKFFLVVPWSAFFFGIMMMLMAAFYGSGHTRPAMVVSAVRTFIVRVPASVVLAYTLKLGSLGTYLGMAAGNITGAALALWLFLQGGWAAAVVPTDRAPDTDSGGAKAKSL